MTVARTRAFAVAVAGCAVLLGSLAAADETGDVIRFAAPRRIQAGGALLGAGRLYPSPVLHDVNGDRRVDIVVGDLMGRVTVALGTEDAFAAETPLIDRSGQQLKFQNW